MKLPEGEEADAGDGVFRAFPTTQGHDFGPASKEVRRSVETIDGLLSMLYNSLRSLPYGDDINFIVTSDHGMAQTSPQRAVSLSDYVKAEWCERVMADVPTLIFPQEGGARTTS